MSVETQELLAVARARLAHRPGDFERFEHALMFDGLAGGNMTLRLLILKASPPATALAALNPGEAARQKQARLVAIVDGWAEKQPCHLSAGVTPLPVPLLPPEQGYVQQSAATKQNQPEAAAPAPMVGARAKPRTWWDVSSAYIVEVVQAGQYATAKELYHALEAKAGAADSPFDKGTGAKRGSLFVREIAKSLSLKTVQNKWPALRELARE